MTVYKTIKPVALIIAAVFAQQAAASGYHFGTQSVTSQSTANASSAEATDATTIFSNPAGLSKLERSEITGALTFVAPSIKYSVTSSEYRAGGNGQPMSETDGSTSGKITSDLVAAPHIYGAYKLNDRVTLGLGVYIPFASSTEYDKDSQLRFHMNKLGLTSVAIEPAVSFKINDRHSIAGGVIAQYATAELRKYADFSSAMSALPPALADRKQFQASVEMKGNDWGFGYHLGYLFDINDRARIGMAYRSKVSHTLKGEAEWSPEGAISKNQWAQLSHPQGGGYVAKENASVKIVTPESLSVHGMFRATDKLNLFGDVTWTRHSRFNSVDLEFEHDKVVANTPVTRKKSNTATIEPNWRNTYKVSLGGSYQVSEPLQLRAGIAFDQSPVRNAASRMNSLPDGNRIWFSAGMKYNYKKHHEFDVAYSHIHVNDTTFTAQAASGNDLDSKGRASAKFKNHADILGVQYSYKF